MEGERRGKAKEKGGLKLNPSRIPVTPHYVMLLFLSQMGLPIN